MRDLINLLENFDITPGMRKLTKLQSSLKKSGFVKNGTKWVLSKDGFIINVDLSWNKEEAKAYCILVKKGMVVTQGYRSEPRLIEELANDPQAAVDPTQKPVKARNRYKAQPVSPDSQAANAPLSSEKLAAARAQWDTHEAEIKAVEAEFAAKLRALKQTQRDSWQTIAGAPRRLS